MTTKPPSDRHTVLIVDDTPENLAVMAEYLKNHGIRVAVAEDGGEGLHRAELIRPDLILLDVMMPDMDGFEACRRLKSNPATKDIPVIFMSASTETVDKVTGLEAGGADYITKPFQAEEVLARINTHLVIRAMQIQLEAQNSKLQHAYANLEVSEARYKLLVDSSPDSILMECEERIVFTNAAALHLFQAKHHEELLGRPLLSLVAPQYRKAASQVINDITRDGGCRTIEQQVLRLDGETVFVTATHVAFTDQGKPAIQTIVRDISESKRLEAQLQHQATHDALTGLPNRNLLVDRLNQAIMYAKRRNRRFLVAFVDLDHFKCINDSLGHEAGDELLKTVSQRITACLRESDTVARIGGDEFVILLHDTLDINQALVVVDRMIALVSQPIALCGHEVTPSCSVGCSTYPEDGQNPSQLIRDADTALYQAKEMGRNRVQIFNPELRRRADMRIRLEVELRRALSHGELSLHYQPQVDLRNGAIRGTEALLRWHHSELGNIPPASFITIAEESGLIEPIGEWVIHQACVQNKAWQQMGITTVQIAVNVSEKQLSPRLLTLVDRCLSVAQLDPSYLELELTESVSMRDPNKTIQLMHKLKEKGVCLSIDDFGTGYSSMHTLKNLPVDKLKLDGSFVREIATDPKSLSVAEAVVSMAHRLDITVVTEMAETEDQIVLLASCGCDQVQGYYFSRPVPVDQYTELLRAGCFALPAMIRRDPADVRILLVLGNDSSVTSAVKDSLGNEGYRLLFAHRIDEALQLLASHPIKAILCNQSLPEATGIEFLSMVKRIYPHILRLIFTDGLDLETATTAINRGVVHKFLSKPWNSNELCAILAETPSSNLGVRAVNWIA